jgi:hypothetical protein
MRWRWVYGIIFTLFCFLAFIILSTPTPKVSAAAPTPLICTAQYKALDGRCMNEAYFSGGAWYYPGKPASNGVWQDLPGWTYVDSLGSYLTNYYDIPPNVDNPSYLGISNAQVTTNFINFINSFLNAPNPQNCTLSPVSTSYTSLDGCTDYRQEVLGAAFIVLTMEGGTYTTYNVGTIFNNNIQTGVADARAVFPMWSQQIQQVSAEGDIHWNELVTTPANHPNSTSFDYAHDVGLFLQDSEVRHQIVFDNPTGTYLINRRCGNSEGNFAPLPPLTTYACGNFNSTPGLVQPNQTLTSASVDDTYASGPPAYTGFKVSIPATGYTNNNASPIAVTATTLSFTTSTLRAPPVAGEYAVNWQLYDGSTAEGPPCTGYLKVSNLPYFSVYGADVSAGGDFNNCSTTGGLIGGWYDNQTAKAGASTLFAAMASGNIYGFASGQGVTSGPPGNGLSMANPGITGNAPGADFGGQYVTAHCLYNPIVPTSNTTLSNATESVGGSIVNGAYNITGTNVTLNGGTVAVKNNTALYVQGNVYISSNVIYGTDAGGTWSIANGSSDIPSFMLVVTGGNIYINPGVTELDGVYVAKASNGKGGTIYTCGQNNFSPEAANNLYANCNHQLTVYGSFVADQVNLMRTYGTLENATANENPESGTTKNCSNGTTNAVCAAEVFNYSSELYLSNLATTPPDNGSTTYNAITSLPPVL